ncbi:hypothetical protein Tco_0103345 [Tanacetum coccineum]
MNQEQNRQVAARDEKWVPAKERVKISTTNAFTISAEVPEIFMQQFWYTVKKVKDTESYEFLLANKKCLVDVEVFRKILDICPRVQGVYFVELPGDEATLTFLLSLGYKDPLHKHPSMENVDYPELIWEDFAFQIDYRQLKKGRRKNMPYPRIGEDFQEYGLPIPKTMLTEGKKTADTTQATVDVSEESDSEPARKRTTSRRVVKNKVTITTDDNIVPEPNVALELEKSISLTEAAEEEAARQVHATYARIATELVPEHARRRPSGIAFRDTSSVSKKMSSDPSQKLKGIQTLNPKEQIVADTMKVLKERKKTSRRQPGTRGSSEGTSSIPGVPDESTVIPITTSEGIEEDKDETIEWVDMEEEEEKKDDDDDKSINLEQTNDEETDDEFVHGEEHVQDDDEETDDEFVHSNEQVNDDEDKEMTIAEVEESGNGDEEITDAAKPSVLTPIPETPSVAPATILLPPPSVSIIPPLRVAKLENDVSELKKIDHSAEALATLKSQVPTVPTPESSKIQTSTIDLEPESEKSASEIRKIKNEQAEKQKMPKTPANHALYHALMEALIEDENAMDKGVFDTVKNHKKQHDDDEDDEDDDEDPSAGPNQGKKTKRRRTKESKSSMKPSTPKETSKAPNTNKPSRDTWFKQPPRPPTPNPKWNKRQVVTDQPEQPWFNHMVSAAKDPLTFDELMATPIDFSNIKLEYNMEECFKALTDRLDWKNTKGDRCPFDLTKPLPLKGCPGHLTVAAEYFFNNGLDFLKSSNPKKKYTTSITKTKAAQYEIIGIEDMVPMLWSTTRVGYEKDAEKGIKHWGERRKLWYRSQMNKFSKHNVYSTQKILSVVSVSVKKLHGYGHLEEIAVRRADRQLFQLNRSDIVDLIMALCMFIRILIIKHRVKDLQLGVESYQKKLNITAPQKTFPEIKFKELYTPSYKPPRDRTLKTVRDELHHRILNFCLGYNKEMSRRKWTAIDKRRSKLMVELIDKQMQERRIIRNLERLVGA